MKYDLVLIWMIICGTFVYNVEAALKTVLMEDLCQNKNSAVVDLRYQPTGILMSVPRSELRPNFDCEVLLVPPRESSVVLSIYRYDINLEDSLTIEDSDRHKIGILGWKFFSDEKKSMISEGTMRIRFVKRNATDRDLKEGFQFTFTSVKNGPCYDNEFRCKNNLCILNDYVCDGHNHCGDRSDQKKCSPTGGLNDRVKLPSNAEESHQARVLWLPIIIAAGVILLIVVIVFIVVVVRQTKRHKLQKANASVPSNASPNNGGNVPLHSVSSTVPQQIPTNEPVPTAPPAPEEFSISDRIRQSLRGKNPKVEQVHTPEVPPIQVPSMYPSLDQAEESSSKEGVENPTFKTDE